MKLTKILTIVLFAASLFLAFRLYRGVQGTIEERESISTKEDALIERLKLIREAEIVFLEVNGRYTSNWDSLADFIQNGKVAIVSRREEITQKAYGQEEVKVFIDTLGFVDAKEKIFKKKFTLNASDNGIFKGYKVSVGDKVVKNQRAYSLQVLAGDKIQEPPFSEEGTITELAPVKVGDEVRKGQQLISYWDYQFNPNVDISKIGEIPYLPGQKLEIFAGKVDKNGLKVQVIEVKDPKPADPSRKESNEAKNRKPLRFGSRTDVSTSGNWE